MAKKRKAAKKISTSKRPYVVKDDDGGLRNLYKFVSAPKNKNRVIHAYKYTTPDGKGPFNPTRAITYAVGKSYEVKRWSSDREKDCAMGLHVATLQWCLGEVGHNPDYYKLFLVSIRVKDVVCVPKGSEGKFRVKKLRVLEQAKLKVI